MTPDYHQRFRERFVEKAAAIEHERWGNWQAYLHSKCVEHEDGKGEWVCFPTDLFRRWECQIATPYENLSEAEKDSDRREVETYMPLILAFIDEVVAEERQETKPAKRQHAADMKLCWCRTPKHEGFCEMDTDHSGPCRTEHDEIRRQERAALIEKVEGMKPPVFLMQDGVSADFAARDAYQEALDDILTYLRSEACQTCHSCHTGKPCHDPYGQRDHTHCFNQVTPPCGKKVHVKCCLCSKYK
jgi:hypothetical protein